MGASRFGTNAKAANQQIGTFHQDTSDPFEYYSVDYTCSIIFPKIKPKYKDVIRNSPYKAR